MNRAELQARIHQHIETAVATAVAAISEDIAVYTAGQVKAAVVPPVVRQRGEPEPPQVHWLLTEMQRKTPVGEIACGADLTEITLVSLVTSDVTCRDCTLCVLAYGNARLCSRNTSQPAHNTERP